ncbi:MAG: hypothetical protein ACYC3X_20930 [Pirellulaceae bacterium]
MQPCNPAEWGHGTERGQVLVVGDKQGGTMRFNSQGLSVRGGHGASCGGPIADDRSGRRDFLRWAAGLFAIGLGLRTRHAHGADLPASNAELPNRPSTSRGAREEALRDIPFANLQEPLRSKIQKIVSKPTIYRRMPIEVVPCDPELYVFLVRYPEIVVNMWQLMGVTKVTMKRTGSYAYDAQDGAGTSSQVELVYGTREKHLFLAEGYYEGPLLPRRVTGRCALLLQAAYSRNAEQLDYVSNRLDVFVQLDNVGAEIVAKTLHPLMGKTADSNFGETVRFLGQVSHVAESNGTGVQRLVTRLNNVDPTVRTRFLQIATTLNQRAIMRSMAESPPEPAERVGDLIDGKVTK